MWLILNGVVDLDWNTLTSFSVTDLEGNTIFLPYTATLCILLSILSIFKSTLEFNLSGIHIQPLKTWKSLFQSLPIYLDLSPFLISAAFFRIASLIAIFTYLNIFGFIPIVTMLVCSIVINQVLLKNEMDHVPNWLILFMSLFVPCCFSTKSNPDLKRQSC